MVTDMKSLATAWTTNQSTAVLQNNQTTEWAHILYYTVPQNENTHRPDNIKKFLSGSFPGQGRGSRGKAQKSCILRPKVEAVVGFLERVQPPPLHQLGASKIFHCFGYWKGFSWTKNVMRFWVGKWVMRVLYLNAGPTHFRCIMYGHNSQQQHLVNFWFS